MFPHRGASRLHKVLVAIEASDAPRKCEPVGHCLGNQARPKTEREGVSSRKIVLVSSLVCHQRTKLCE
jgi:hypothetical protein